MSTDQEAASRSSEGATALRNGLKLATSLLVTWGVALVITFKLPKYLGPVDLGFYRYGFEYAATLAVFVGFGIDTYISRDVAIRPKHASDFFGGILALRTIALVPIFVFGWFHLAHKLPEERLAAALFGVTHVFIILNLTLQQTLQAAQQVSGLAVANVVAKLAWGGTLFLLIVGGAPFWVLPLPMLISEALKAGFLFYATKHAVDLELKIDLGETKKVLLKAFPFFVANAAVTLGSTIDTVILRELVPAGSPEVGWYSSARDIAKLSALLSPAISGVIVPMMSKAHHRNPEDLYRILRRGLEGAVIVSLPLTLMLALSADFVVAIALKAKFTEAAVSLRWLAPTFVLAYMNVLLWTALMIEDRSWTITIVSFLGMALIPLFLFLIVPVTRDFGPGGSGMGAAISISARELVIVIVFFALLGRKTVDRRSLSAIGKSLAICAAVLVLHTVLAPIGPLRLIADGLAYAVLAVVTGVVRVGDVKDVLRMIRDRKKPQPVDP